MKKENPRKPNVEKSAGKNQKIGAPFFRNRPVDTINNCKKNRKSNRIEQHGLSTLPK